MTQQKDKEEKICDLTDVMEIFRKYQIIQYILIFLAEVLNSMVCMNFIFTVADVNFRCQVDACEDENSTAEFPTWWPDTNKDKCSTPVLRNEEGVCTNTSFTGVLKTCDHWIYENNNSVVAEFNLACQPWMINMAGSIHFLGLFFSMVCFGWISDNYGRKPVLIFSIVAGVIGITKNFTTSYYTYLVVEFLEAIVTGGYYPAAMVMLIEISGKKYRLLSGITCAYAIYFGEFLVACIAKFVPYWKNLVYIIYGPSILFILFIVFIKESPRWLIVSGRIEEAKRIMKQIADSNKIQINNEELENMNEETLKQKFNLKGNEINESMKDAFKSREIVKRFFVSGICRFISSFVYYGMMVNSVWLPGDKYINFLVTAGMSFPGELLALYLMNKIGRKMPLLVGFIITGVLCFITGSIPSTYLWAKLSVFFISKMILAACFTAAITYSMELFPTSVRGQLLGYTSFFPRLGGMLAPLTPVMNTVSEMLPFIIFGCASIVSGILLCLTPETKGMPLSDTIEQVDNYKYNKTQKKQQTYI